MNSGRTTAGSGAAQDSAGDSTGKPDENTRIPPNSGQTIVRSRGCATPESLAGGPGLRRIAERPGAETGESTVAGRSHDRATRIRLIAGSGVSHRVVRHRGCRWRGPGSRVRPAPCHVAGPVPRWCWCARRAGCGPRSCRCAPATLEMLPPGAHRPARERDRGSAPATPVDNHRRDGWATRPSCCGCPGLDEPDRVPADRADHRPSPRIVTPIACGIHRTTAAVQGGSEQRTLARGPRSFLRSGVLRHQWARFHDERNPLRVLADGRPVTSVPFPDGTTGEAFSATNLAAAHPAGSAPPGCRAAGPAAATRARSPTR